MNLRSVASPRAQLLPVFREQVSREIQSDEFVAFTNPDRLQHLPAICPVEKIRLRVTISVRRSGKDRKDIEAYAVPPAKLRPYTSDHTLNACLCIVTDDRGNIDE